MTPRVQGIKKVPVKSAKKNNSPAVAAATNKTRSQAKSSSTIETVATAMNSPGDLNAEYENNNNIQSLLNDVLIAFNGIMDQVSQFKDALQRLEQGFSSTIARVTTLEQQVEDTKSQNELFERRLEELESENTRLNDILNQNRNEVSDISLSASPPSVSTTSQSNVSKLQYDIENLQQAKRANEIILSGHHIKSRIKKELDSRQLSTRSLCVDIIARIPGLQDCDYYIQNCQCLQGNDPKLLVQLPDAASKNWVFKNFFKMKGKKPFYVNENLIPTRAKLLYELRLLKKSKKNFSAMLSRIEARFTINCTAQMRLINLHLKV